MRELGALVFQAGRVESTLDFASIRFPAIENICNFNEAQREATIQYKEIN